VGGNLRRGVAVAHPPSLQAPRHWSLLPFYSPLSSYLIPPLDNKSAYLASGKPFNLFERLFYVSARDWLDSIFSARTRLFYSLNPIVRPSTHFSYLIPSISCLLKRCLSLFFIFDRSTGLFQCVSFHFCSCLVTYSFQLPHKDLTISICRPMKKTRNVFRRRCRLWCKTCSPRPCRPSSALSSPPSTLLPLNTSPLPVPSLISLLFIIFLEFVRLRALTRSRIPLLISLSMSSPFRRLSILFLTFFKSSYSVVVICTCPNPKSHHNDEQEDD